MIPPPVWGSWLTPPCVYRESFDSRKDATEWRDVSGGTLAAKISGVVYLNETMGGGALRFGSAGGDDRAVLPLDLSPRGLPEATVEASAP